jgi:hypothetical protein
MPQILLRACLQTLLLHDNMLTSSIPPSFALPSNLTILALHNNKLSGAISKDWKLPSSLQVREAFCATRRYAWKAAMDMSRGTCSS